MSIQPELSYSQRMQKLKCQEVVSFWDIYFRQKQYKNLQTALSDDRLKKSSLSFINLQSEKNLFFNVKVGIGDKIIKNILFLCNLII